MSRQVSIDAAETIFVRQQISGKNRIAGISLLWTEEEYSKYINPSPLLLWISAVLLKLIGIY